MLAATGPLMVVAGVMPTTFAVMGVVGQPLLFLILGVVLALFSVGYAEMSRHVHNAGAFYAYISRGLGPTAGAGAALVALVAYSVLQVGIYGMFGFEVSNLFATYLDLSIAWWIPALVAVLAVGALALLKIDVNARVLGVLLLVEVALVVVFDVAAIGDPAKEGLSLHAFNPDTLTGAGVGTALCFCIAAFTGFEQAPVYAEETSRPHILVPRVMFMAVGFVAVFFAISSWALTVAAGPSAIIPTAQKQSAGLMFFLTESRLGGTFTDIVHVLFVTGMFAALLSFHNVVSRYAFAMGREGLLPATFGRTNSSSGAPGTGSLLQTALSLIVVVAFAVTDDGKAGDPTAPVLKLFTWGGNVGALGIILLMAAASLAVIVFFVRRGAAGARSGASSRRGSPGSRCSSSRSTRSRTSTSSSARAPAPPSTGCCPASSRWPPSSASSTASSCAGATPRRTPGSASATRRSSWRRRPAGPPRSDRTLTNTRGPWPSEATGARISV